jgi:hypothetical protein
MLVPPLSSASGLYQRARWRPTPSAMSRARCSSVSASSSSSCSTSAAMRLASCSVGVLGSSSRAFSSRVHATTRSSPPTIYSSCDLHTHTVAVVTPWFLLAKL